MSIRKLAFVLTAALSSVVLTFCGPSNSGGGADAGGGDAAIACNSTNDCPSGECINKVCIRCPETQCAQGYYCNSQSRCVACSGTCPTDAGSGGCSKKTDCPTTMACRSAKCQYENATGQCTTSNECSSGRYCSYYVCTPGCETNDDCVGVTGKPRCDTTTNTCAACAGNGDCTGNDVCILGECKPATTCTDRTPCGQLACIGGKCAACANNTDCGQGFTCNAGQCKSTSNNCTSDDQCRQFMGACAVCTPGTLVCNAPCSGAECNATTHQCMTDGGTPVGDGGSCDCASLGCETQFPPSQCDPTTCTCGGGGGSKCDSNCGCTTGTCSCFGYPLTIPTICAMGVCDCK